MGGQGKPLEMLQKQAFSWSEVEGKRRDGLQRAPSCSQNQKAAEPVWLQGGFCQPPSPSKLPKIKFHMLWAKVNFLFQGLEHTALLKLPSAPSPVPAPGSLFYSSPAKGAMKTKPTLALQIPP